ncbi:MAG: dihydroneopterin aldolase [Ferruginibacter sp.]
MFSIHLNNLKFFSFHGVHEEERVLGGEFIVNAEICFDAGLPVTSLEQTFDYTKIYALIKQRMGRPSALLETVAQDLAHEICGMDQLVQSVDIAITKVNPPIQQFRGNITVRYKKDR